MVEVINRSQQVRTAGLNPRSDYSRIIAVHANAAGGGVYGFGISPTFGKNTWLLGIDVTVQLDTLADVPAYRSHFSLHRGSGDAPTRQIVQTWDRLIDFGTYAGFHGMVVWGKARQFHWNLRRRFDTEANRFGVVYFNASTPTGVIHAFFEMSEG